MVATLTLIVLLICLASILGFWFIGSLVAEYYGWNSKSVSKFFKGE